MPREDSHDPGITGHRIRCPSGSEAEPARVIPGISWRGAVDRDHHPEVGSSTPHQGCGDLGFAGHAPEHGLRTGPGQADYVWQVLGVQIPGARQTHGCMGLSFYDQLADVITCEVCRDEVMFACGIGECLGAGLGVAAEAADGCGPAVASDGEVQTDCGFTVLGKDLFRLVFNSHWITP